MYPYQSAHQQGMQAKTFGTDIMLISCFDLLCYVYNPEFLTQPLWCLGNALDLDSNVSRILGDLNARPRRLGSRHELFVDGVHPRKVLVHILEED